MFEAKVECIPEKWSYVGVEMYVIATPVPLSGSEKVFHELSDVGRGDVTGSNEIIKRFPMSTCCRISNEDTHFSKGPFGFVCGVTFWMRAYPVYGASSVGKGS